MGARQRASRAGGSARHDGVSGRLRSGSRSGLAAARNRCHRSGNLHALQRALQQPGADARAERAGGRRAAPADLRSLHSGFLGWVRSDLWARCVRRDPGRRDSLSGELQPPRRASAELRRERRGGVADRAHAHGTERSTRAGRELRSARLGVHGGREHDCDRRDGARGSVHQPVRCKCPRRAQRHLPAGCAAGDRGADPGRDRRRPRGARRPDVRGPGVCRAFGSRGAGRARHAGRSRATVGQHRAAHHAARPGIHRHLAA